MTVLKALGKCVEYTVRGIFAFFLLALIGLIICLFLAYSTHYFT